MLLTSLKTRLPRTGTGTGIRSDFHNRNWFFYFLFPRTGSELDSGLPFFLDPEPELEPFLFFKKKKKPQEPEVLHKSWEPPDNAGPNQQGITKIWEVFEEWVFMEKGDTFSHQTK